MSTSDLVTGRDKQPRSQMRQVLSNDRETCVIVEFTQSFLFLVRSMSKVRQADLGDLILREDMMHEATGKGMRQGTLPLERAGQ